MEISKRQRRDWLSQADLPVSDPNVRREIKSLSEQIARAIDRMQNKDARPIPPRIDTILETQLRENSEGIKEHLNRDRDVGPPKVVLWVDDRPDNNIFERAAMEKYNVQFVLANSTEEAIAKLSSAPFDAIISDMGRPPDPRAGCTLLQAVRSRGNQSHILFTPDRELLSMWWSRCAAGPKGQQTHRRNSSRLVITSLRTEVH